MLDHLIVADDLTGAIDAAAPFATRRGGVLVVRWPAARDEALLRRLVMQHDPAVVAVDTSSRNLAGDCAASRVERIGLWSRTQPRSGLVIKKVDSLLRGSIASEVAALVGALAEDGARPPALMAPALPAQGRTTIAGVQLQHGIPVDLGTGRHDPLSPTTQGTLRALVPAGYLAHDFSLSDVRAASFENEIAERAGPENALLVDAESPTDLMRVAQTCRSLPGLVPIVTSGFTQALAQIERGAPHEGPAVPGAAPFVIVTASQTVTTHEQLDRLRHTMPSMALLTLRAVDLTQAGERAEILSQVTERLRRALAARQDVAIVVERTSEPDVEATPSERQALSALINHSIASLVGLAFSLPHVRHNFMVLGGDVLDSVCTVLDSPALRPLGEVRSGLIMCQLVGGAHSGRRILVRSGGFGAAGDLVDLLALHQRQG